jgi:hypothetical protein
MDRILALSYLDIAHFIAGCLMLLAIWGALFVTKGSRAHKSAGRFFVTLFLFVAVTSIPRIIAVYEKGDVPRAFAFLTFALLLLAAVAQALAAVFMKNEPERYFEGTWRLLIADVLLGSGGIAVIADVMHYRTVLLGVFGALALLMCVRIFVQNMRYDKPHALWWKAEHMYHMIGLATSAHVGLVLVAGFLLDHKLSGPLLALLSLPLIAITIAMIMRARKKYLIQSV